MRFVYGGIRSDLGIKVNYVPTTQILGLNTIDCREKRLEAKIEEDV